MFFFLNIPTALYHHFFFMLLKKRGWGRAKHGEAIYNYQQQLGFF